MNQEVLIEKREIEFVPSKPKLKCPNCKRKLNTNCFVFNRILKKDICHQCNKKIGTNPFYTPDYGKRKGFIGKFNINEQEKKLLITNLIKKGVSYKEAKRRIANDVKVLSEMKKKKNYNNRLEEQNKKIQSETSKEMKNKLLKGLGLKKDDN